MASNDFAGLQFYSNGIVAKTKTRGDDAIEVDPIEKLSMDLGDVSGTSKQKKSSLPNQHGVTKSAGVKGGSVLVAKWIAFGCSNRETPPDVVVGETVMIWRYADTNDYYWTTMFREPSLRRQETVRYVYSNQPSGRTPYDEDSSYWLEYDTVDKHIHLHTSSNDGEPVDYDVTIDTKLGTIEVKDDIGNVFFLDSPKGQMDTTTNTGVSVTTQKFVINASTSVEINTPSFTLNGESSTINASSHTENAAVTVTGGLSVSGGSSGSSMAITGDIALEGDMTGTGSIVTEGEVHGSNLP